MNKLVEKTSFIAAIVVALYLFVSLMGLFQVAPNAAHHMHMQDCPYALGEQSLCSMNLFDRMGEWKLFSTAIVPLYVWLALLAAFAFVIPWRFFLPPPTPVSRTVLARSWLSEPLYQALFSSGILHPKAP